MYEIRSPIDGYLMEIQPTGHICKATVLPEIYSALDKIAQKAESHSNAVERKNLTRSTKFKSEELMSTTDNVQESDYLLAEVSSPVQGAVISQAKESLEIAKAKYNRLKDIKTDKISVRKLHEIKLNEVKILASAVIQKYSPNENWSESDTKQWTDSTSNIRTYEKEYRIATHGEWLNDINRQIDIAKREENQATISLEIANATLKIGRLSTPESGCQVKNVYVKEGQFIAKGQLIMTISDLDE